MTRPKKIVFALVAIALASTVSMAGLLLVDVYLHGRYERSAGYNVWGYRGPRVAHKKPGELRVVMLGGSTAYGYGVNWEDAIPAQLERALTSASAPATVVNLGYNNEGAYSLRFTLEDYLWLDYDAAILYEGYNDVVLNPPEANRQVFRRDSPVFRWTGYLPIFPVIFKEKAAALRTGGEAGAAYTDASKTVFRPGLAARGAAGVLSAAVSVGDALEQQLNAMSSAPHRDIPSESGNDCDYPWTIYCQSFESAIAFARAHGVAVIVVGQPEFPPQTARQARHDQQQQQLARMIERHFGADHDVHYLSMRGVVDLADPSKSFDQMHLTADGNRLVAERLAGAMRDLKLRRAS
ncbi:MAG: GDSL-type esterase/lipase family protein [Vicinamibacterales bacterium]